MKDEDNDLFSAEQLRVIAEMIDQAIRRYKDDLNDDAYWRMMGDDM